MPSFGPGARLDCARVIRDPKIFMMAVVAGIASQRSAGSIKYISIA
jgi:hypothetical protein